MRGPDVDAAIEAQEHARKMARLRRKRTKQMQEMTGCLFALAIIAMAWFALGFAMHVCSWLMQRGWNLF